MSLLSGTPREVLTALINAQNSLPVAVTDSHLYFGRPRQDVDGVTTILPTVGVIGSEYEGYTDFKYRRIDLAQAFGDTVPVINTPGATSLHRMLPAINQWLGLNLTEEDVQNVNISALAPGQQINLPLQALDQSLGYRGRAYIRFLKKKVFLSVALSQNELDELNHVIDPALNKVSIALTMWDIDFTPDRNAIEVINGRWKNEAAVQTLLAEHGITGWAESTANQVKDYSTEEVPGSNKAFRRVVVQTNIDHLNYAGDAYFHYNA